MRQIAILRVARKAIAGRTRSTSNTKAFENSLAFSLNTSVLGSVGQSVPMIHPKLAAGTPASTDSYTLNVSGPINFRAARTSDDRSKSFSP